MEKHTQPAYKIPRPYIIHFLLELAVFSPLCMLPSSIEATCLGQGWLQSALNYTATTLLTKSIILWYSLNATAQQSLCMTTSCNHTYTLIPLTGAIDTQLKFVELISTVGIAWGKIFNILCLQLCFILMLPLCLLVDSFIALPTNKSYILIIECSQLFAY